MTPKERAAMQPSQQADAAMRLALEALESCNVGNWSMAFDEFAVVEAITALREALAEQAEQEPVAWGCRFQDGSIHDCICPESHAECEGDYNIPLYAAPVRTKDLTDDEIWEIEEKLNRHLREFPIKLARAVIAADREKNK